MTDGLHGLAEDVSLELHRAVAERLLANPALLERARRRVAGWLRDGTVGRTYAEAWQAALAGSVDAVARLLSDPGERARALRQTSPFAGFLEPRTRWAVWRRARGKGARP
ncbi:MAG TPA: hypothetical protein VMT70_07065 [Vicinamibacteria bacterium]|nr:hypothetical protein [Vicinamibacteria bacterium]